jgi:hypothetical protein
MKDDLTPIGSCQEASSDAKRAPGDGDDAQRASPGDGACADVQRPKHPKVVLPNVMWEGDVNAETKSVVAVVGEVVLEVKKNPGVDQYVPHLSHFLFISVISYFLYLSHFLHCPSIKFLEAVLVTLHPNPVRQRIVLPQSLKISEVWSMILPRRNFVLMPHKPKRSLLLLPWRMSQAHSTRECLNVACHIR